MRLAELDREESHWQQRIIAWRAQKAVLGAGDPTLQQLTNTLFSPDEQRHLGACEQTSTQASSANNAAAAITSTLAWPWV